MSREGAPRPGATSGRPPCATDCGRAILEERARSLAHAPSPEPKAVEAIEVVTFSLADERYAIETRYVREIARLTELTPVPGTPDHFSGVVNQRGELLAVVDLRKLWQLEAQILTDLSWLVVLGVDRAELGIRADAAHDMERLPAVELREPTTDGGIGREHVRGVTRHALVVLDAAALLRDDRLFVGTPNPASDGEETGDGA